MAAEPIATLQKELRLMRERIGDNGPEKSIYFALADTIAAKSCSQKGECHGWLGIKLQFDVESWTGPGVGHFAINFSRWKLNDVYGSASGGLM